VAANRVIQVEIRQPVVFGSLPSHPLPPVYRLARIGTSTGGGRMQVRDGMSKVVLTVNPGHTLREAARAMAERNLGAAVVIDPDQPGPGIVTERDILLSMGRGQDPDKERVSDHLSSGLTFASPEWSLERAAEAMVRGSFRHLVVVDGGDMAGILSMRDIVRCWVTDYATSEFPREPAST
jgi:CBS domain-containing protein